MNPKQRDRGRILTSEGLNRLQQAIAAWELKHEVRCTQEKLRELTIAQKPPNGLDPGTISKILEAQKGVDPKSIRCLFKTLGLELDEADLISSARLPVQADPNFVGREGAIADLNLLVERGAKVIVIQARGGVGKTTLARKYLQQEFGSYLEFPIAKETKDIASIESLVEEKLRQLGEEPGREFFVSLDRLKRKLQAERLGILIDNLEPALDSTGKFVDLHRRYVELLRVLADPSLQSITLITTRERLRESSVSVEHYILKSLDISAWEQFFQSRNLAIDTLAFAALHNAYGGNAKAMDIIRGAVLEDYSGDIEAYWQANQDDLFIERDLEDLVTQQFDRLQQTDIDAYHLLCRMGCYRYQDVPTVLIEGLLCLLWNVPENRQRRVVKSLQDRSLLEFENGKYCLHPIIRNEAIARLRVGEDWEIANRRAGYYWTNSVNIYADVEDALKSLEAYYHYFSINDFDEACRVIVRNRANQGINCLTLGGLFGRLGLFQPIIYASNQIIRKVESEDDKGILYDIMSDINLAAGNIHESINLRQELGELADKQKSDKLRCASLIGIGKCKIRLWEIKEAKSIFEYLYQFINSARLNSTEEDYYFLNWNSRAIICEAYLTFLESISKLNTQDKKKIFRLAEKSETALITATDIKFSRQTGPTFIILALTYKNLKHLDKAIATFKIAISLAEEYHFNQVKAMALIGLAEIHRYQEETEVALAYHSSSIHVAIEIGAKCELAEAYYQLGLTHQAMDEDDKSSEYFHKAIQLFDEMKAPKQVERVRRSTVTDKKG